MLTFLPYSQFLRMTEHFTVSQNENTRFCDLTPGNLLLWEDYLSVSCAAEGDRIYLRFNRLDGQVCFLPADGRVLPQDLPRLTEAAKAHIGDQGYDPIYGARPLKRFLQSKVETLIARMIIAEDLRPQSVMVVDYDGEKLTVHVE